MVHAKSMNFFDNRKTAKDLHWAIKATCLVFDNRYCTNYNSNRPIFRAYSGKLILEDCPKMYWENPTIPFPRGNLKIDFQTT